MDPLTERFLGIVRSGDRTGLERLLGEQRASCQSHAQRIVGNGADADDAVQDAFVRLMRQADAFDGAVPFGAALHRLVVEASLTIRQKAARRRRREVDTPALGSAMAAASEPAREDERLEQLRELVAELPAELKAPIELRFYGGMSQKETAQALGISENVVAVRVHRGKEQLRRRLARAGIVVALGALEAHLSAASGAASVAGGAGAISAAAGARAEAWWTSAWWLAALFLASLAAWPLWHVLTRRPALAPGVAIPPAAATPVDVPRAPPSSASAAEPSAPSSKLLAYTWNFDAGAPSDLRVISGAWHHLDHGGIGNSGCMETDSEVVVLLVDRPVLPGTLEMTAEECPRAPPSDNYQTTLVWDNAHYQYEVLNYLAPSLKVPIDARHDNLVFHHITERLGDDVMECGTDRTPTILQFMRRRNDAPLKIFLGGHQRIDDLRIAQTHAPEPAEIGAIRRRIYAVPLAQRRGTTNLPGVPGFDRHLPVRVLWGDWADEPPLIAP